MKRLFSIATIITFYALPFSLGGAIYSSMTNKAWAVFLCFLVGYLFSAFGSWALKRKDGGVK